MSKQAITPEGVHRPVSGYSHAVRVGDTVYVAGQVPLDPEGNLVGEGDCRAQSEQVFHNLKRVLEAAGSSLDRMVKINVYLTRAEDVPVFREVRGNFLASEPPASTIVVISGLVRPDLLVEVEAVAVAD